MTAATQISSQVASGSAGAGAPFNAQEWASEIETTARDFRVTAPLVRLMTFKGPADKLNIPKVGLISAAAFLTATEQGDSGSGITYTVPTNYTFTITPSMSYAATRVAQRELDHANYDLEGALQDELAEGLALYEDQTILQAFHDASFTTTDVGASGANYTEALVTSQIQSLVTAGKSKVRIGPGGNTSLVFHSAQLNDLLQISSIASYEVTGKDNGPALTGKLTTHWGVGFYMSDNGSTSGSDVYCPMFSREALFMARLYKPKFRSQWDPDFIGWKLVAWQEFGWIGVNILPVVEALVAAT